MGQLFHYNSSPDRYGISRTTPYPKLGIALRHVRGGQGSRGTRQATTDLRHPVTGYFAYYQGARTPFALEKGSTGAVRPVAVAKGLGIREGDVMGKQIVKTGAVAQPIGPYSLGVRSGNLLFVKARTKRR